MKMSKAYQKMKTLYDKGVRRVWIFYTREVDGKKVPNYRRIALTAGMLGAASAGAYAYMRHKKYGHVFRRKK